MKMQEKHTAVTLLQMLRSQIQSTQVTSMYGNSYGAIMTTTHSSMEFGANGNTITSWQRCFVGVFCFNLSCFCYYTYRCTSKLAYIV